MENKFYFVLTGLLIYGGWRAILFFLYRKDTIELKENKSSVQDYWLDFHVFIAVNLLFLIINSPSPASFEFSSIIVTVIISLLWNKIIEPKGKKERVEVAEKL